MDMEITTLMILMASAVVVLTVLVVILVMNLFNKNDELKEKNDVIVREVRRNQALIDRAVQNGVKRASMLSHI
jgi:cell division protein FtsL